MKHFNHVHAKATKHVRRGDYHEALALFVKLKTRYMQKIMTWEHETAKAAYKKLHHLHLGLARLKKHHDKREEAKKAAITKKRLPQKASPGFFSSMFKKRSKAKSEPAKENAQAEKVSKEKTESLEKPQAAKQAKAEIHPKKISFLANLFHRKPKQDNNLNIDNEIAEKLGTAKEEKKPVSFREALRKKATGEEVISKRRHKLKFFLNRAGVEAEPNVVYKRIFTISILITLLLSGVVMFIFAVKIPSTVAYLVTAILFLWTAGFLLILVLIWSLLYAYLDLQIFKRKVELEEVLPDFLQLTAANIRAGLPIDKALWYAIRPRFGVLAREIEMVAKETMAGKDLKDALKEFSMKYDSAILQRSVNLLIEGLEAGGEIGDLLNKISLNIQELRILHKEMAANVTTYIIFISFANVIAAPFLLALSNQLIKIVSQLSSRIDTSAAGTSGLGVSFGGSAITSGDFQIFAVVSLAITSFFSSIIIATIKKGNIKGGLKYIPMFIISSIVLFFMANFLLTMLFGSFF